jgi:hypothetical protein
MRTKGKRFSVSLTGPDYAKLRELARKQRPPASLTLVVNKAIHFLFDRVEDPQKYFYFVDPLKKEKSWTPRKKR